MDDNYDTGELDIALMEYAAAHAHVKDMQAKVDALEVLKKKRRKGYSAAKWTTATVSLAAAKSALGDSKAWLDAVEAREKEAKDAMKGIADSSPSPPSHGGEGNMMPDKAVDRESEEMHHGVAKNIGQDGSETHASASKNSNQGINVNQESEEPHPERNVGQDRSDRSEMRAPASEKNIGRDAGSETLDPASEKNGRDGSETRAPASEKKSNQENNVNQESEEPHPEKNVGQDGSEMRAPASKKNIGRDASSETRDPASEKNVQDGSETCTPASEKKSNQGDNVNQDIEGTHLDVAGDQESREMRAPASKKIASKKIGDQGCEARNGSEISAPSEPNMKKRKHDGGDGEETAGAEGHMGPRPRKVFKNKANGEEIDEAKILSKVNKFVRMPISSQLSIATRSAIRTHQALAPAAATTTRSLALKVLTTNRRNVLCPYHQEMDKKGVTDSKYLVNGVPLPRLIAEKKKEANSAEHRKRLEDGFLHCGCPMDAALWDFFFWKSLTLTATIKDKEVTEHVSRWTPRDRAFFFKLFKQYTFLQVDDLYTKNQSQEEHEERMLMNQLHRILDRANELREKRGAGKKALYLEDDIEDGPKIDIEACLSTGS